MAVPKRRRSKARQRKRRTHFKLSAPTLVECSQCNQPRLPHQVCPHCGYYNGREVIVVTE